MIKCYNVVGRFSDCATSGFTLIPPSFPTGPWNLDITADLDPYIVLGVLCLKVHVSAVGGQPLPDHSLINANIINNSMTTPFRAVSIDYYNP